MSMRVDESYQGVVDVTPSDTVNITYPTGTPYSRALYVETSGDLSLLMADSSTTTLSGVTAKVFLPIGVVRVNATGTTATDIKAFY